MSLLATLSPLLWCFIGYLTTGFVLCLITTRSTRGPREPAMSPGAATWLLFAWPLCFGVGAYRALRERE